ncbi:Hypothetical predicted protein [Drosophila guanche]|uniref:Uncharacterized protein n=1 Tax=Drosophila guanche TaxID=7266 RepID=A0A3B0JYP8_DROGU|nr:Hypothetical predicted protein [Drosophila guanche]
MVVTSTRSPLLAQSQPASASSGSHTAAAALRSRLIFPRQHYQVIDNPLQPALLLCPDPKWSGTTMRFDGCVAQRHRHSRTLTPRRRAMAGNDRYDGGDVERSGADGRLS